MAAAISLLAVWAPGASPAAGKRPQDLWADVSRNAKKQSALTALDLIWQQTQAAGTAEAYRDYLTGVDDHRDGMSANDALIGRAYGYAEQALDAVCRTTMSGSAVEPLADLIGYLDRLAARWPGNDRYKDVTAALRAKAESLTVNLWRAYWDRTKAANTVQATSAFVSRASDSGRLGASTEAARNELKAQADALLMEQRWSAVNGKVQSLLGPGGGRWEDVMGKEFAGDPYAWLSAAFGEPPGSNHLEPPTGLLLLTNALVIWKAFDRFATLYPNNPHRSECAASMEKLETPIWNGIPDDAPMPFYAGFTSQFSKSKLPAGAKAKLDRLASEQWKKAKQEATLDAYGAFLSWFPENAYMEELKGEVKAALGALAKNGSPVGANAVIPLASENAFIRVPKDTRLRYSSANRAGGNTYVYMVGTYDRLVSDIKKPGSVVRGYSGAGNEASYTVSRQYTTSHSQTTLSSSTGNQWVTASDSTATWKVEFPRSRFVFVYLTPDDYNRTSLETYLESRQASPDLQVDAYADLGNPLIFNLECPTLHEQLRADGLTDSMIQVLNCPERIRYVSGAGVLVVKSQSDRRVYSFGLGAQ
jgi:hypothetical protein